MKNKVLLVSLMLFIVYSAYSQDPYIVTGEGIGQYGYVEADAVTYTRLNSNTHGNVLRMAARWWADGSEWVYETGTFSCGSGEEGSSSNFSHANLANWDKGEIAYVSVYAQYCGGNTWSQTGTTTRPDGMTGYNERQFRKVDVITTGYSGSLATDVKDGQNNLVGTFIIDAGTQALTLDRFWIQNTGSSEEVNDIPNDAIKLYYENVTGSEMFDGGESNVTIYGNYGGNATNNNEYGHDDLNIPIAANGTRVYVVISDLNNSFNASRNAQFSILNDGISFQEVMSSSYNLMRIDATDISGGAAIPLPVQLTAFNATTTTTTANLFWQTASEHNNAYFDIEKSINGETFETIGTVAGNGTIVEVSDYEFIDENPVVGLNYYRLKQVDFDGEYEYSEMIAVDFKGKQTVNLYPNPAQNQLHIKGENMGENLIFKIYNVNGQLVQQTNELGNQNLITLDVEQLPSGIYFLQLLDAYGTSIIQKRFVKN